MSGLTAKISTKCLHHRPYICDFLYKFKSNFFNYIYRQIFISILALSIFLFFQELYLSFSDLLGNCPNFSYKQYKSKSKWLCFYYLFKCQKKQERNHRTPFSLGSELTTEAQTSFENALLFQSIYKVHRKSIQTLRKSIHLCTVQQTWLNSFVLGLHFRTSSLQTHLGLKIIYGNLGTSPQSSIVLFSGQTYIVHTLRYTFF